MSDDKLKAYERAVMESDGWVWVEPLDAIDGIWIGNMWVRDGRKATDNDIIAAAVTWLDAPRSGDQYARMLYNLCDGDAPLKERLLAAVAECMEGQG